MFKLLERKSYEVQERPKMTINGNQTISTYFILNKRDRSGKAIARPFQTVLDDMKRQETETAKLKQSTSLKGTHVPAAQPALSSVNENDIVPPSSLPKQVSIDVPMSNKRDSIVDFAHDSMSKARQSDGPFACPFESMSEQRESTATTNSHMRSKTCNLL